MNKNAKKEKPEFNREECIACTMCVNICPTGARDLEIRNSSHGFRRYPVLTDEKEGIGCNACEKEYPTGTIRMVTAE